MDAPSTNLQHLTAVRPLAQLPPAQPGMCVWLARRPARVGLLLCAVGLLNGFDLVFTIMAARLGAFIELNPVASRLLGDPLALGMYKIALVVIGSCLLWRCRYHQWSEMGCWFLCAVYTGLAWRWLRYYQVWNYYCHGGEGPMDGEVCSL